MTLYGLWNDLVMKTIDILGDNRYEKQTKTRVACRGIMLSDEKILLTYETNTDQWFIPGGGLENDETFEKCCIREMAEETGCLVKPRECFLTINEYYEEWIFTSHYFWCDYVAKTERKLTERELEVGLEPRWISVREAVDIFSKHQNYAEIDEMKRGAYLREYTALKWFIENKVL